MAGLQRTILCFLFFGATTVLAICPETFERHGTQCYKIFMSKGSWIDSIRYCRLKGSQLLSIQSEAEQKIIDGIISRIRGALDSGSFWIGGSDLFNEGVYSWFYEDGQYEPITGYFHWGYRQPATSGERYQCMSVDYGRSAAWSVRDCNELKYAICETRVEL